MTARTPLLLAFVLFGCSTSDTSTPTPTDGTVSDAPAPGTGCTKAGGMCGCAGGCQPGYHPASRPLLDDCPQPCAGCGGCSMQCCLKDDDAGSDASADSNEAG